MTTDTFIPKPDDDNLVADFPMTQLKCFPDLHIGLVLKGPGLLHLLSVYNGKLL